MYKKTIKRLELLTPAFLIDLRERNTNHYFDCLTGFQSLWVSPYVGCKYLDTL